MAKMQVFISWSGPRSQAIAKCIRDWLPIVLPQTEPWVSTDDIPKGAQWLIQINQALSKCTAGLIVITPENQSAPWLVFEAGAAFKAMPDRLCCPILCSIKDSDLTGPLPHSKQRT